MGGRGRNGLNRMGVRIEGPGGVCPRGLVGCVRGRPSTCLIRVTRRFGYDRYTVEGTLGGLGVAQGGERLRAGGGMEGGWVGVWVEWGALTGGV